MMEMERMVMAKVTGRLVPFLILCYLLAYLDRVNVGFAALTMNDDLGFSPTVFGWGAGIFFFGYFLFEVPSNLLLDKFGARRWIARIMISWGLISTAMILVRGEQSFYAIRFLLGVAEAGFFPGIIYFLTIWFPNEYRARMVGLFMIAVPLSSLIGAPLSGAILDAMDDVAGLAGWQWLFIVEGLPTLAVGVAVLLWLTDRPAQAHWLSSEERDWLERRLAAERSEREKVRVYRVRESLRDPWVLLLGLLYFCIVVSLYGVGFWMPQMLEGLGSFTNLDVGLLTAVPYGFAAVCMVLWGQRSDRTGERRWHLAATLLLGSVGFLLVAASDTLALKMIGLCMAAVGIYAGFGPFWSLPSLFLTGTAAAAGIALINSIGNLGGFAGPYLIGWLKETSGAFQSGLTVLGIALASGGLLALGLGARILARHAVRSGIERRHGDADLPGVGR
jgi:ACS family tartrate transporter-like MFS transporter